ncbi:MAG TPA: transketolase, partial [Micromonospora sp.]
MAPVGNAVPVTTPQDLDERFREAVGALVDPGDRRPADKPVSDGGRLTGEQALELFDAQLPSRHLDLAARGLRSFGEGFYTIGSAGHEGNAAVAAALHPTDPALLHYRSGGFYCARLTQAADPAIAPAAEAGREAGGEPRTRPDRPQAATGRRQIPATVTEAARDVLRGVVASAEEPGAGGRHKVFGNLVLAVVPTTS